MAFKGLSMQKMEPNRCRLYLASGIFSIIALAFSARGAAAATLYFSPASGSYGVGQKFSVSINVASADQAMNAVSGAVAFPGDKLQVDSFSKSGSIISLWIKEPSFTANSVNFEGFVLNPGYTGKGTKVLTINFHAKATGSAKLTFSAPQVLANDGQGTSILSGSGTATLNITKSTTPTPVPTPTPPPTPKPAPTPPPPVIVVKPPLLPVISSTDCPDQTAWYSINSVKFQWTLPEGTTGVSFISDDSAETVPAASSIGLYYYFTVKDVKDGVNYFHVRLKNAAGWGPAAAYKYQIDTAPPDGFEIKLIDGAVTENTKPSISWNANDAGSGVDHYELKVDDQSVVAIAAADLLPGTPYVLPEQAVGDHRIAVTAIDKAGNRTAAETTLTIKALEKPAITAFTANLNVGEQLAVAGETGVPGAMVMVWVQKNGEAPQESTVQADDKGHYYFVYLKPVGEGDYKVWAQMVNGNGGKSIESEHITIPVKPKPNLTIVINSIFLLIILLIALRFAWRVRKIVPNIVP
jgi:hypothetical protein